VDNRGPQQRQTRVRIERPLPAPMMDGFDVHGLSVGQTYELEERLARYLIIAGYAVRMEGAAPPTRTRKQR
jgi:hypothetical protein